MTDQEAFEAGYEFYKAHPELILAALWHRPECPRDIPLALEFLEGYKAARRQRDEYSQEKKYAAGS